MVEFFAKNIYICTIKEARSSSLRRQAHRLTFLSKNIITKELLGPNCPDRAIQDEQKFTMQQRIFHE
jgi:hypothetical protein